MPGETQHAQLLEAVRRAVAGAPPAKRFAAAREAARSLGYILDVKGSVGPGLGASLLGNGVSLNVPLVYDFVSNRARYDKAGLSAQIKFGDSLVQLGITPVGLDPAGLTRVDAAGVGYVTDALGLPFGFTAWEDDSRLALQASVSAGLSVKNQLVPGGVDFLFGDFTMTFYKKDDYFSNEVAPTIWKFLETYNNQNPTDQINEITFTEAMKARLDQPNFTMAWTDLAFLVAYEVSGKDTLNMPVIPELGGGPNGQTSVQVGKRKDGNLYIAVTDTKYLGTNLENEATFERRYAAISREGEPLSATSVVRYEFKSNANGGVEADLSKGITVSGWDGMTGPNSKIDSTKYIADQQLFSGYLQAFDEVFKGNCFAAGTPVRMADGSDQPIEMVQPGDLVAAYDEAAPLDRRLSARRVLRTFRSRTDSLYAVGDVVTTAGHPFLCADGKFRIAEDLAEHNLVAADGSTIANVPHAPLPGGQADVFNLEIEEDHTYIAGEFRVHNVSLKLDGTDGYVSLLENGDAIGALFNGRDQMKVLEYRKSANYARVSDFNSANFSERVWNDLAKLPDEAGSSDANLALLASQAGGELPKSAEARRLYLKYYDSDLQKVASIDAAGSFGSIIGGALGARLFDGSPMERIAGSTVLSVIGENFAEFLKNGSRTHLGLDLDTHATIFSDLPEEIAVAGIGAVSSYLVAELVNVVGVDGMAGDVLSSTAGTTISKIASNLVLGHRAFDGLTGATYANVIGSYLGTQLASAIVSFDTIGGQLGSSIGSSLGALIASTAIDATIGGLVTSLGIAGTAGTLLAGALTAGIGAFVGFLAGGLIGSIFGGTPRSGADVVWNDGKQIFEVANAYARKGGSKDAAVNIATTVAATFNSVLSLVGGELQNPSLVTTGNYGMRGKEFVYRLTSTRDDGAITRRFSGKDATEKLIEYGVYHALTDHDFRIVGGDVYIKRALYNSFAIGGLDANAYDSNLLIGNLTSAQQYSDYRSNPSLINALVALEPESVLTAELAITLARAAELGINKRHEADWFGGWGAFLTLNGAYAADAVMAFQLDDASTKTGRIIALGGGRALQDTIDTSAQIEIYGGDSAETIDLRGNRLHADFAPAELEVNGEMWDRLERMVSIAAVIFAFGGDDTVHASDRGDTIFGGDGDDILRGGRLDDWLLGGEGNDEIDAGSAVEGSQGGDGNYLSGGIGNDILRGREGSDWLEGGDGVDQLEGGAGGDVLAGGAGEGDTLHGGTGSDQYVFRRGDGHDILKDESDISLAAQAVQARLAGLSSGALQRNWSGGGQAVQDLMAGGEDAIVFGDGIDFRDVILRRSSVNGQPGADLIIELTTTDANGVQLPTGDVLTVQNWFDDTRRIEWLKFADGTELRIGDVTSFIIGTAGDDVLIGTGGADFLAGGDGNDTMRGLGGDDFGFGGRGKDLIAGDEDDDWLVGGDDDDQVIGGWGNDTVFGDSGNDKAYGGVGNDLISGGRGNDQLVGGGGNDVFRFQRGDGRDVLFDDYAQNWELVWEQGYYVNGYTLVGSQVVKDGVVYYGDDSAWNGVYDWRDQEARFYRNLGGTLANSGDDTLEFGLDIGIANLQLKRSGNDLLLAVESGAAGSFALIADQILLKDWYATGTPIEHFVLIDVGRLDLSGWSIGAAVTDGDDTVQGGGGIDWVTGGLGNDTLAGGGGNDILSGNAGNDTLKGESGADILFGGTGNDLLDGGAGPDELNGGGGIDVASYASSSTGVQASLANSAFNGGEAVADKYIDIEGLEGGAAGDTLSGDDADNILRGLGGNDVLRGGGGDDSYEIGANEGEDVIEDGAFVIEQILDAAGNLDTTRYAASWEYLGVETGFGDWHAYRLTVRRLSDNQIIYESREGVDFLYQAEQAGMPTGTTWPFADGQWKLGAARTGNGVQTIVSVDVTGDGGADALELGAGISLSDLSAAWENDGTDLRISVAGGGSVLLRNQSQADRRIETLTFADGLSVDLDSLRSTADSATGGADLFLGTSAVDTVDGGAGNDVLSAGAGDDVLSGGDGDDILEGGAGVDVLNGGSDSVASGHVALANDPSGNYGDTVRYTRSAQAISVFLASGIAFGGDAEGDTLSGIENVTGSEAGGDFVDGSSVANRLIGLGGNDILAGNGGDDVLIGGDGNDNLQGGDGDDAISGDAGSDNLSGSNGHDVVSGGEGGDTITGGAGNDRLNGDGGGDTLRGDAGDDILAGGDGDDFLYGGAGADTLVGGAGLDTVSGDDGNDILVGGAENDLLQGGYGNDTYSFDAGAGANRILDKVGSNRILFSGVSFEQIWMTRSGSDLLVRAIGTNAAITVQGYYAASAPSLMTSISTGSHTLFLSGAAALIDSMTAVGALPGTMPQAVKDQLASHWVTASNAPHVSDQSRTTNEDTALSGTVGAVDEEGDISAYAVTSAPAHGAVSIHASTGAWTYTPTADWNGTDGFDIRVTDAEGHAAVQHVTVVVAPVNDGPRAVISGTLAANEMAQDGDLVGVISATDIDDASGALVYSLVGNAGGRFRIDADGSLRVNRTPDQIASGQLLDREGASSHLVRVRVSDAAGLWREQDLTVTVGDTNEAPFDLNIGGVREAFEGPPGAGIGWVNASDPEGNIVGYTLVDSADGHFAIDSNGYLRVGPAGLDYETASSHAIIIRATDAGGLAYDKAFTVTVKDLNEAPYALAADGVLDFAENQGIGTPLVRFTGSDPDNNIIGYSLTNDADGRFEITNSGELVVGAAGLNYETGASHTITVKVTDAWGVNYEQDFAVSITNVNEAPAVLVMANDTFAENIAPGTILTTFEGYDPDGDTLTYSLVDSAGGRFAIDAANGLLKVGAAGLDYETGSQHTIIISMTDSGGLSVDRSVVLTIVDANEAPTDIRADRTLVFDEDRAVGDLLAVLSGVDPENNVVALELVSDAGGRFTLDTDWSLRVGPAGLDYEAGAHTIVVRARDSNGLTFDKSLTITVADINEAPTDVIATGALVFDENQAPDTPLVSFVGADPEGGSLTYSLQNDAGDRFAISTAGALTVGAAGLDHEAGAIQSILVRVADSSGLTFDKWFDITVANVNEAPTSIIAPVLTVAENAGPEAILGTVSAVDPDTPSGGLRFRLDDDSNGRFTINEAGEIRTTGLGGLSYEDGAELFVVVRVTDPGELYLTRTVAIGVTDVNEAPTSIVLASSGAIVSERDQVGDGPLPVAINLGVLSAIDPDLPTAGDFATLLFTVEDPRFEILSGNQLWLKAGAMDTIDYETNPVLSVAVTVTDRGGNGLAYTRTLSFAIEDQIDRIVGTAGDDVLTGQIGRDVLNGYGGVDVLQGNAGDDKLFGGDDADRLYGGDGDDELSGELGDDKLYGGAGDDQLSGGEGDDTVLDGGEGNDTLWGGTGLDTLTGGSGNDQLFGEEDNDILDGGAGADRLEGGAGEDVLAGGAGADHFVGGEGEDIVTYAGAGGGVTVDLAAGTGSAGEAQGDVFGDRVEKLVGSGHGDRITGSALRDLIYGGEGTDIIYGGGGDDVIFGGGGDDYINAEDGGDQLDGGAGIDTLVGGNGNDTYLMHADSGADDVHNYDPNGLDFDTIGYQGIGREQLWFERSGDDLIVSAIGTSTVTTVKGYFVDAEPGDLANFKIDFISTQTHETINLEGLLALMAGYAKPVDAAAYGDLHEDLVFENQWQNFWDENGAPTISEVVMPAIAEDQYNDAPLTLNVRIADVVTPATGITVTVTPVNGDTNVVDTSIIQSVTIGGPDAAGNRLLSIRTRPEASGPAAIRIVAMDPGGLATEKIIWFNVDPLADAPVITRAQPDTPTGSLLKPTLDSGGWDLDLQAALKDQDGSEVLAIRISGVPTGLSFNHGTHRGGGVWDIPTDKLDELRLLGPATWSQDIALTVTATAQEQVTDATASTTATLNMVINARPTDLVPDRTVVVNEKAGEDTLAANFSTTDADMGDTRSYSLRNDAGGRFEIDGATGALTVLNGAVLDYETATTHNVVIRVTDSGGLTYDETVAVAVANVNEAPTDLVADRSLTLNENTAVDFILASFSGVDPEANITGYSLANNAGGRFTMTADGKLKVGATGLDFESGATRTIVVRATDAGGLSYDESFTVTIANVNEAPTNIVADRPLSFAENIAVGTTVAEFAAVDPEGNVASYSLSNNAGGRFTLDGNKLKVGAAGLNHEAGANVPIVVRATDAAGLWYEKTLAVSITNVEESPTDIVANRALTFSENTPVGDVLATLTGVDPESNITGYQLVSSNGGRLTLTSAGDLKVGAAGLDYEAGATISIIVRAADAGGFLFDKSFTVTLTNVNEAPVNITANNALTFAENATVGSVVATFTASDPDSNVTSYSLVNDTSGRFTLTTGGQLTVGTAGLNYEAGTSIPVVIRATDAGGLWYDKSFTVTLTNVNEVPTDLWADRTLSFEENIIPGDGLAWFGAADPDGGALSYSLISDTGGRFAVRSDGLLMVGSAGLNYEAGASQSILVRVTDAGGAYRDEWFNTVLTDVNETPIVSGGSFSMNETDGPGTNVGTISFSDPDILNTTNSALQFVLSGTGAEKFAISSTGVISYHQGVIDQDISNAVSDYALTVTATDQNGGGLSASSNVNIHVNAVNEAPFVSYAYVTVESYYGGTNYIYLNAGGYDLDPTPNGVILSLERIEGSAGPLGIVPPSGDRWIIHSGYANYTYGKFDIILSDGQAPARRQRVTVSGTNLTMGPVVLDLDGDGVELTQIGESGVLFDMDGDGTRDATGWVGSDDALLVVDRNGNGLVDDGSELALTGDQPGAASDLEGLRAYDSNGNGFFDTGDAQFDAFRLWRDVNQDGVSQVDELITLGAQGIVAINLTLTRTNAEAAGATDTFLYGTTQFTRTDGTMGTVGDVFLAYQKLTIAFGEAPAAPQSAQVAGGNLSEEDKLAAPIILDLDADGKTIVPLAESTTLFDMAGDGQRHKTAWADAGDGFLVRDRNGNGVIDDIAEISFVGDKAGAQTDLEGLAGFDGNGDKILDANDSSFAGFAIWKDANANGRTDAGELQSLADAGIGSIGLVGTPTGQTAAQRTGGQSVIFNTASFTRADGSTGSLSDAGLAFDAAGLGAVTAWTGKPVLANDRFNLKSGKSRISAYNGQLVVRPRGESPLFDPGAGAMAAATTLRFRDKSIAMLGALVLDLDGDGLDLEHQRNSRASFDMDGNGARDNTGWVSKGDGFLVIDRDGDGRIGSGAELNFLGEKSGALTNFEGLAVLDGNRDGKLNATDVRFGELKVWFDRNLNGVSEDGELQTLAALGITEVGLRTSATQIANQRIGSNLALSTATFTQNGKTRTIGDVAFAFSPSARAPVSAAGRGGLPRLRDLDDPDMPLSDALTDAVSPLDTRLALMRQAMSGFGTGSAAETRLDKAGIAPAYDFYAASAA